MRATVLTRAAIIICGLAATVAASAQTKVAVIRVQEAIARTQEGQGLIKKLEEKYKPTRTELEAENTRIKEKQDQWQKGANTMSEEARRNLGREIETMQRDLQRSMEDAQGEFAQEQNELFNSVGTKLVTVIDSYAKENGIEVVLDISNPQSPVLYAVPAANITDAVIAAYDAAHPSSATGGSSE